ncbi:MAG TPA: ATP-binding protein [Blastocatellia bacterium]|nr:ATP-binding protein [Blastocatellia bacterium]
MSSARQSKVFLIGDREYRRQIAEILLRHSYIVGEANGSESVARIESFQPDVILLDASLPQFDSLIQQIRGDLALSKIPVLLTVEGAEQAQIKTLEAGVTDFLRKPIAEAELIARVRTLAALRFAREEQSSVENRIEGRIIERTEMLESALRGQGALLSEAREARRIWEATFNAMADAIVITDAEGQITLINNAASEVFHRTSEELAGQNCDALLIGDFTCPHRLSLREQDSKGREILSRAGDRLLNVRASSFLDAAGQVAGFVHVFRDVTRERVLERHLMQAERMSLAGLMVSAVAHEVATPLSVISNIAEMLLMDVERGSQQATELNKIVTQARRVAEMMRSILNFVRQRPAQFDAVNLAELARETLDLLEYELRKLGIQATVESSPAAPAVWGDAAQLQQVLLNLVTNAIQAMKNGGRLRIRISEAAGSDGRGRSALLIVEDTGQGITPEALDRLFDFFFTTKMAEGGTGLGLAISRQIVEGHGGTMAAENIEGGGARFLVKLPAAIHDSNIRDRQTALIRAESH